MTNAPTTTAAAAPFGDTETVTLETPIQRSEGAITQVVVRKPRAGELRGLALTELLQLNVTALQALLPRVTTPILHKQDLNNIDPVDLVSLGTAVVGFLLPKAQKADFLSA